MFQSVTMTIMIIFLQRFSTSSVSINQFTTATDCACHGYNVTYQCTVFGSGATVWKGTAFDCSLSSIEFVFLHDVNFTSQKPQTCNNGAIIGRVVRAQNDSYISQLIVQISDKLNGTSVICAHDNGTDSTEIGSATLNIPPVLFPLPTYVQLIDSNSTHLSFNWSPVSLNCSSIQYHIVASNCGECPTTIHGNMVTCSGNYMELTSDLPCWFAVQTAVCNDTLGNISIAVSVSTLAKNLHTENGIIMRLIIPATVVPVVVLMGIILILGPVLVYLLISRKSIKTNSKPITNHCRCTPGANTHNIVEVELTTTDNNLQGIGVYSYLQSTEDQDQNPTSKSTDDITYYADLGPNTATRAFHLTLLHDDRVQYEEIRLEIAAEASVCGPQTSSHDQEFVNLDLLLILLKEEVTPRWYEFGLVVGVPKDVMDSYLGYPSDQCLIEMLDYWLRHHLGQLTWKEVAQALRETKFYHLAEKALQVSTTGQFPLESNSSKFGHHDLRSKEFPSRNANESQPELPHKQEILGATKCMSSTSEYEDTAGILSPPPLPPKTRNT